MVGGGVQGGLRHRVHGAGSDQLLHVQGVPECRVLHPGGGPQGTLGVGAGPREGGEAVAREDVLVRLVGQSRVGEGRLSAQAERLVRAQQRQALVDLAVDAGDEEGRDRVDAGQVDAGRPRRLQAGEVGVHDLAVALQGEDQRDVDADPGADDLRDRRETGLRRRDLDHHVGAVDQPGELLGLGDRGPRVVGQPRVDLDGHPAVPAAGGVVHPAQHVGGGADVGGGHHADRLVGGDAPGGEVGELLLVLSATSVRARAGGTPCRRAYGGLEDRRVGGDADDVLRPDQLGEVAGLDPPPRQVVQPDGHALVGQAPQCSRGGGCFGHSDHLLFLLRRGWAQPRAAARDSLAAAATCSAVKPNSVNRVFASEEAPKCSSETMRPASPTYRCQVRPIPASTATRARTDGGSTLSR